MRKLILLLPFLLCACQTDIGGEIMSSMIDSWLEEPAQPTPKYEPENRYKETSFPKGKYIGPIV